MAYKNGQRVPSNTTARRRQKQYKLDEDRRIHTSKDVLPVYVDPETGLQTYSEPMVLSHWVVEKRKGRTYRKPKDDVQNRNEGQESQVA